MTQSLDWSRDKQLALMGHLLTDNRFAAGAGSAVEPEWFGSETGIVKVRQLQVRFRDRFKRLPTVDEVREGPDMRSEEPAMRMLVARSVEEALAAASRFPADALAEEIRHWHKSLVYRAGVSRSAELYRAGQAEQAFAEVERMLERLREADRDRDHRHRWGNFREMLTAREAEYADALTLGHPLLDKRLMPESDSGSLIRGQTTIVLSGTNRGKSRFMTTVVKENFLRKKRVLWMTHEDPEIDVSMNMWCSLLRVNRGDLMSLWRDPKGAALMDRLSAELEEYVEFAFMPPTGLTVEEVTASIRRRQAESIASTGRGFDLLVDDYPKKLSASRAQGDFRHVLTYVYDQFVGLALEYNMHSLLAFQTNREGHAASMSASKRLCEHCRRNPVQARWINETDCGEAWAPMENVANVISLNRDKEMERMGLTAYYFAKTKSSQAKGWVVACRGDYGAATTHAPDLGATSFQGEFVPAERLSGWIDSYKDGTVPDAVVRAVA